MASQIANRNVAHHTDYRACVLCNVGPPPYHVRHLLSISIVIRIVNERNQLQPMHAQASRDRVARSSKIAKFRAHTSPDIKSIVVRSDGSRVVLL